MYIDPNLVLASIRESINDHHSDELRWVGGRVTPSGRVVVLLHRDGWDRVVGYSWEGEEDLNQFGPERDAASVGIYLVHEMLEPEDRGVLLESDWATTLVDSPEEIAWLNADIDPDIDSVQVILPNGARFKL